MGAILDAFWRALGYCLHPRMLLWSLLPMLLAGATLAALGWFFWEPALDAVRGALERWDLLGSLLDWLAAQRANHLRAVIAPLIVVTLAVPIVVVVMLVLVSLTMMPAMVRLVAARRFPALERRQGARFAQSLGWALACLLAALLAMLASVPLWFVPPLVVVLPPLIWGWLSCRVLAFDALAQHASADERRAVLHERRWALFGMGLVIGFLGALPSLAWAFGAATLVFAPLLLVASVWLYTLLFAFAAGWFAHFSLAELQRRRGEGSGAVTAGATA